MDGLFQLCQGCSTSRSGCGSSCQPSNSLLILLVLGLGGDDGFLCRHLRQHPAVMGMDRRHDREHRSPGQEGDAGNPTGRPRYQREQGKH